jgi:hypothetical protein
MPKKFFTACDARRGVLLQLAKNEHVGLRMLVRVEG